MRTALIALPFVAQLIAPATPVAADQSQFTRPSQSAETMRFRDMDRNRDGVVTRGEWQGTARSFEAHDWNRDGILSGDEVREGAQPPFDRGRQDSGIRDDREETFEDLDVNRNNQIERHEWHASADAFEWLDRNKDGVLTRREVVGRGANRTAEGRNDSIRNPRDPRTAVVGTTGQQNCEPNAARIVDDVYQQVLQRSADQASGGFTQSLSSGRMTVRDLVAQVAKSEEHATRYFWQPVTVALYQQMLNRQPNPQELQQTSADLAAGQRQLIDVVGRMARRASNSEEEAVKILYRRLLGREADEAGLRGFTEQARTQGIESVARDLVASAEYRQRGRTAELDEAAYESAVKTLHRHVIGRDPDAATLQTLVRAAATQGFNAVVDAMVASNEYERLYGADVVPGRGSRYCGSTR